MTTWLLEQPLTMRMAKNKTVLTAQRNPDLSINFPWSFLLKLPVGDYRQKIALF
jgi:hypothetical protein